MPGGKIDWAAMKLDALLAYYNREGYKMSEKQATNHKPFEESLTEVTFDLYIREGGAVTLETDVNDVPSIKHLLLNKTITLEVVKDEDGIEVLVLTAK